MSSILKALRKLEDEKAAIGEGRVDLARDILKRSAPQRKSDNALGPKVLFFSVLLVGCVFVLWLLLGSPEPEATLSAKSTPPKPVAAPAAPVRKIPIVVPPVTTPTLMSSQAETDKQLVAAEPPVAASVSEPEVVEVEIEQPAIPLPQPTTAVAEVEKKAVTETASPEPVIAAPAPLEPDKTPASAESEPGMIPVRSAPISPSDPEPESAKASSIKMTPAAVAAAPAEPPQPAPEEFGPVAILPADLPPLSVSAIAYRQTPGERLAVVNDLPVMEGTSIGDVQILEIMTDGVQFSWNGKEFFLPVAD